MKDLAEVLDAARLFGTIMGNNGAVVSVIDPHFNLLHVNYLGQDIFRELHEEGYSFEGKKCYGAFRNAAAPCPECRTAKVRETRLPERSFIHHNTLVDKVFRVGAYPVNDTINGEIVTVAVIEVAADITPEFLAAGIVHDANNLLVPAVGCLDLVARSAASEKIAGVAEDISMSREALLRTAELLSDLQKILSGSGRKDQYTRSPADVKELLESSVRLFQCQYAQNDLAISADLQDVPSIVANKKGLQGVFENIILNAFEAFQEAGTVNPELRIRLYHQPAPVGGYIHIEFEDNGPGIKPEHIQKIFDPYFTTKSKGHGLGLGTAKQIIERRHFGKINACSPPGRGARFEILLPDPTRLKHLYKEKKCEE